MRGSEIRGFFIRQFQLSGVERFDALLSWVFRVTMETVESFDLGCDFLSQRIAVFLNTAVARNLVLIPLLW